MNDREFFAKVLDSMRSGDYLNGEETGRVAAEVEKGINFYSAVNAVKPLTVRSLKMVLEEVSGVGHVDPTLMTINDEILGEMASLLSPEVIIKDRVFPIKIEQNSLQIAMRNPTDEDLLSDLEALTGCRIAPQVSHDQALIDIIEERFRSTLQKLPPRFHQEPAPKVRQAVFERCKAKELDEYIKPAEKWINVNKERMVADADVLKMVIRHPSVIQLVHQVLTRLVLSNCSDLHFEPLEHEFRIRSRVDGAMRTIATLPLNFKLPVIARLKVMANLRPEPARVPQDAQINYNVVYGRMIEFRFSALPSILGEKVVLRVLDRAKHRVTLDKIFPPELMDRIGQNIHAPNGLILVTGPTGSGKTSTLYAVLDDLNRVDVNIVTAEHPVESKIHGITQVQCDPEDPDGVDFNGALRSFLRQDPDIIMVGEIRDQETAEISLKAALTGHLVLSTLHTNDAAATIMRLVNMQLDPFLIAAALRMVIAQRLIRVLCNDCKLPVPKEAHVYRKLTDTFPDLDATKLEVFTKGPGCEACERIGFRGRRGIFEVLICSSAIQELIIQSRPITEIVKQCREEGMLSLFESGLGYVARGTTSLEEVMRVAAA